MAALSILVPVWQAPDEAAHTEAITAWLYDPQMRWGRHVSVRPLVFEQAYDHGPRNQNLLQLRGNVGRGAGRPDYLPGVWGLNEARLHERCDSLPVDERLDYSSTLTYPQGYYWLVARIVEGVVPARAQTFLSVCYAARGCSALGITLVVIGIYALVWWISESLAAAFAITLAYTCNGLLSFLTAVINPDGALFGLYAVGAAMLVRLWIAGRLSAAGWAVLTVACVAGPLIKPNGLLLPVAGLGAFVGAWLLAPTRLGRLRVVSALVAIAVSACAVHAFALWMNGPVQLNGEPCSLTVPQYLRTIVDPFGKYLLMNLIGQYGWFDVDHSIRVYGAGYAWLVGGVAAFLVRRGAPDLLHARQRQAVLLLVAGFGLAIVGVFAYQYVVLLPSVGFVIQGRYFAFGLMGVYVAAGMGLRRIGPPWLGNALLGLWVSLAVFIPFEAAKRINSRFYAARNWEDLISRASQYKPAFLKGGTLEVVLAVAAGMLLVSFLVACTLLAREAWLRRQDPRDGARSAGSPGYAAIASGMSP